METAPTPLSMQVQQTYFELHKKSMPELDIWTQSELQWGALKCAVLGMFYPDEGDKTKIAFSGDVNSIVSAHRYRVYAPDDELLDIIVNGLVQPKSGDPLHIGEFRPTENLLAKMISGASGSGATTSVRVSMDDFKGTRTAMFGKTRLGKSNVVKLLAQAMIDATESDDSVGQLIFDINGEYANDNEWDGSKSIRSANEHRCEVYAINKRPNTPSKKLRMNFYENPDSGMGVLGSLLSQDNRKSIYVENFASVTLPSIESLQSTDDRSFKARGGRLIQAFWAILDTAGFRSNEDALKGMFKTTQHSVGAFDPHYDKDFRKRVYGDREVPRPPESLAELRDELSAVIDHVRGNSDDNYVKKTFEPDDLAMFGFFKPTGLGSAGARILSTYRLYHDPDASDFEQDIIKSLDGGKTIILDLGNANDAIRSFFSDRLSKAIFAHQERKFTSNRLGSKYVHLYFEEAHNLFPASAKDLTGVYSRFAKEGAKFHIGMTYSTQSPSTIYGELLVQTENFFVGHLSSSDETKALSKLQRAFLGVEEEIMRSRTPGYMRMLTRSHRFVVPVQAHLYEAGGNA